MKISEKTDIFDFVVVASPGTAVNIVTLKIQECE